MSKPSQCGKILLIFGSCVFSGFVWGLTPDRTEEDVRPLCECGSSSKPLQTRVVGGKNASPGDFPYATGLLSLSPAHLGRQVLGTTDFTPFCGGTLITDRHVVTAAHCVRQRGASDISLDVGEYSLRDENERRVIRGVKSLTIHPRYVVQTFKNDIAIIELTDPVELGTTIKTAWLPPQGAELAPGTPVTVYGWGRLEYDGGRPKVLQVLQLPVVSRADCQKRLVTPVIPAMLCAGGQEGKDACIGDSGSGLTVKQGSENILVGIVSFGKMCALPGVAGVYTKLSHFVNWIKENTRSSDCQPCVSSPQDFS